MSRWAGLDTQIVAIKWAIKSCQHKSSGPGAGWRVPGCWLFERRLCGACGKKVPKTRDAHYLGQSHFLLFRLGVLVAFLARARRYGFSSPLTNTLSASCNRATTEVFLSFLWHFLWEVPCTSDTLFSRILEEVCNIFGSMHNFDA